MIDVTKSRNNYTKYPTTLKQKCEPVLLVQQKQQQQQPHQQLKQPTTSSRNVAPNVKKQSSSSIYAELKPALTVKQIGGHISGRSFGIGRGIPIATRIESQRITAHLNTTSAAAAAAKTTYPTATSVRKANQQFFLIPDYQDKNFLKDECAIAHAQVAPPPPTAHSPVLGGKRLQAGKNVTRKSRIRDFTELKASTTETKQISNNNNNIANNNNNTIVNHLSQDLSHLNINKTTFTNVMRRGASVSNSVGYGNTLESTTTTMKNISTTKTATSITATTTTTSSSAATGTTNSTTATHRIQTQQFNGIEQSNKSPHSKPATATTIATKASLTTPSANNATGKGNNVTSNSKATIKPLVHRSIPATATATATATTSSVYNRTTTIENVAYTNSVNNNSNNNPITTTTSSNCNNNSSSVNNNIMAASTSSGTAATLDHDDIKYIDSDENTGMTPPGMGKFVECVEPPPMPQMPTLVNKPTNITSNQRLRPKSTIVCSNNQQQVFEKINSYKYTNGSVTTGGTSDEKSTTMTSASRRQPPNTNIDPNSIKASIEKFNNFSEQKQRVSLANAVTMRHQQSGTTTGSTSNLQYHRHSGSDFESSNMRQLINSNNNSGGGGSLTRNPYRASTALTSNNSNNSAPQPVKAKVRMSDGVMTTSTVAPTPTYNNKSSTNRTQQQCSAGSDCQISNEIRAAAGEESIRSSVATKNVLPPASPTTSRYWDRETRDRTSTALSSSYNHLDGNKSTSDEKSEGLCGLRNIGNTCFMNSIIQCLSHTNELTKFLRNYSGMRSSSQSSKDHQILLEFAKLIREMWTSNVHSVTPMDLKRAFSSKHRMYSDYNQQDAQEFLRFFLDSLHSALNSGVKGEPLNIDDHLSDNRKAELTWDWYTRYENSLIRDLFVGQLKSTLRCTACGNTSVTFDPFWDLSVSLPSSSRCKLDACLELFIREEVLDGDEMPTCAKCKTRRKCTKSFSIQRFPKYLVIHLKRFSETRWSKMSNIVEFPTGERELNMGPYGANPNTNMYYSLYAISNHMGSTAGGHYVALCKHPISKKWHEFNDNIVSDPLYESHLVSSSAYILFYERA